MCGGTGKPVPYVNGRHVWYLCRVEACLDRCTQPTCAKLAENGYVGIENGRCWGKYFDTTKYFIECGASLEPTRLIVLNGADYTAPMNGAPVDMDAAERTFEKMYTTSQTQRAKYYKE